MSEAEFDGVEVLRWLKEVGHSEAGKVLVGCGLDNQVDDDLLVIEAVEPDGTLICRLDAISKRIPPAMLARTAIIDARPSHPLGAAIDGIKSPDERALAEQKANLRKLGLTPEMVGRAPDPQVLIKAMEDHQSGRLPSMREQSDRYEAFKAASLHALGAKVIQRWREISLRDRGTVKGSILIKLAYCLRHSGEMERGLKVTDPIVEHDQQVTLSQPEKAILATLRGALLLDFYKERPDADLLAQARDCAEMASRIEASKEIDQLVMRLEAYERRSGQA